MFSTNFKELVANSETILKSMESQSFPRYDISEDDSGNTVMEMSCAGFDKEAFSVSLDKGLLSISGSPLEEASKKGRDFLVKNLSNKDFNYKFPMWVFGQVKDINCSYEDGIFKVVMKKKEADTVSISWRK